MDVYLAKPVTAEKRGAAAARGGGTYTHKGSAINVGARRLSEVCEELQRVGRARPGAA